jgi:PAS domain S-box-containing protein
LNALNDEIHIWKVIKNSSGEIIDWILLGANKSALNAWKKAESAVIGKSTNEIFEKDVFSQFKPIVDQIFQTGELLSWTQYFEPSDQHLMMDSIPLGNYFISAGKDITDRIKIEENLKLEEEKFRLLFEDSLAANLLADDAGNYIDVNAAAVELFAYSKSDFLKMNVKDLKVLNNVSLDSKYSTFIEEGLESGELQIINGNKEIKTVLYKAKRFKKDFNLSVLFDITDRKKTELTLENTLTELRLAQKIAKLGNWEYKPKEKEPIWSKEIFEIFELDPNQAVPSIENHRELLEKESFELLTESLEKATKKGIAYNIELAFKEKQKWIRSICITEKLANDEGYYLKGVVQDISEEKKAERLLKKTLLEQELAHKIAKLGYWEFIAENNEQTWSKETYELFGLNPNEPLPSIEKFKALLEDDSFELLTTSVDKAVNEGTPYNIELAFRGHKKWIRSIGRSQKLSNGKGYRLKGVVQDITDQKEIERKLKISNETKDRFFSIIAHDLKNPLINITSITELINKKHDSFTKEEIEAIFKDLSAAAKNTHFLLDNLLDWARSERGQIGFNPTAVTLSDSIKDVFELLTPLAKEKDVALKTEVPKDFKVYADGNMLATILRNLVSNGIKFSHQGGQITLSAKHNDKDDLISVKDNGIGMKMSKLNELFNSDHYTPAIGSEIGRGTGIGLQLCKEFVAKHGGTIEVESEEGKGSLFTFTLKSKQS